MPIALEPTTLDDLDRSLTRAAQPAGPPPAPKSDALAAKSAAGIALHGDSPAHAKHSLDPACHTLAQLNRLAQLLAVEDGYDPAVREFVIPRDFKLPVVIPVSHDERTIRQVVAHVAARPRPKEIIVVDDASTDGTRQVLSELEPARDVHVIFKPRNEGKGAALRTGLRGVSGTVVVIQDADLE